MGQKTESESEEKQKRQKNWEKNVRKYMTVLADRFELGYPVLNPQHDARKKALMPRGNSGETEFPPQESGSGDHSGSGTGEVARVGLGFEVAEVGTVEGGKVGRVAVDQVQQSSSSPPEVVSQKMAASGGADFLDRVATEFGLEELDNVVPGSFHVEWFAGK